MNAVDYVKQVVEAATSGTAHTATKYVSPKLVVKATRRLLAGALPRKNERNVDIVLTMGQPNYADRLYIKQCLKAGEPFPVKKLRVKNVKAKHKPKVRSLAAKVLGQTRQRKNG